MRRKTALWLLMVIFLTGQACLIGGTQRGGGQPVTLPETGSGSSLTRTPFAVLLTEMPPTEGPKMLATPTPEPGKISAPSPSPLPPSPTVIRGPLDAVITTELLSLRQGPGTLFAKLGQVRKDARVRVLGRARGANWVYIDTGAERGWVAAVYTSLSNTAVLAALETIETPEMQVIHGQVLDRAGKPVPGVQFALYQGRADSNPPLARATTDEAGDFYIYLPAETSGTWRLSLTGADCGSPAVDERCQISGAIEPRFTDVTLPVRDTIEFLLDR